MSVLLTDISHISAAVRENPDGQLTMGSVVSVVDVDLTHLELYAT